MRITFGSIVVDGRGKLGGHVVGRGQSGPFLATIPRRKQSFSAAASKAQYVTALIQQRWRALSELQRRAWNEYSFGNYSGINAFLHASYWNAYFNGVIIITPPFETDVSFYLNGTVQVDSGISSMQATLNFSGTGGFVILKASAPQSLGVSAIPKSMYVMDVRPVDSVAEGYFFSQVYNDKFGGVPENSKFFFEVTYVNDRREPKVVAVIIETT